jgi:excisionase family DNA binding protein
MSTQSQGELLTVQQLSELLQVPVSWIYGRTRKRSIERLPAYRLGKYWRFNAQEVMSWLRDARRQSVKDNCA